MSAELFKKIHEANTIADLEKVSGNDFGNLPNFISIAKSMKQATTLPVLLAITNPSDHTFDTFFKSSQKHLNDFFDAAKRIKQDAEENLDVFLFKLYYLFEKLNKAKYEAEDYENVRNLLLALIEGIKKIKVDCAPIDEPTSLTASKKYESLSLRISKDYEKYVTRQNQLKDFSTVVNDQISTLSNKINFESQKARNDEKVTYLTDVLVGKPGSSDSNNLQAIRKEIEDERSIIRPIYIFEPTVDCHYHRAKFNALTDKIGSTMTQFSEDHGFLGWLIQFRRSIHHAIKLALAIKSPSSTYALLFNAKTQVSKVVENSFQPDRRIISR